jgi:hypothetical protein
MGIKQLMNIINEKASKAVRKSRLYHFSGKVIACDANMAIYQFLIALQNSQHHYTLTDESGNPTSHLSGIFYRTIQFLSYGIKPVWVFDGKAPDQKMSELKRRKTVKNLAREKILAQKNGVECESTAPSESKFEIEEELEKSGKNEKSEKSGKNEKSGKKKKKVKLAGLKKSIEKLKNITENGQKVGDQAKKVREKGKNGENCESVIDLTDGESRIENMEILEEVKEEEQKKKFKKLTVRQWQEIQKKKYKEELEEIETSLRSRISEIISSPLNDLMTNDYMCVGESDEEDVGITKELEQIVSTLEHKGFRNP